MGSYTMKSLFRSLIFFILGASFCDSEYIEKCPGHCSCTQFMNYEIRVTCSFQQLTTIPHTFPKNTTHLFLHDNDIVTIPKNAFSFIATSLKTLWINRNKVSKIELGAFNSLTRLKSLDLSENRLVDFPYGLLRDTTTLTELDLSSNLFTSWPSVKPSTTLEQIRLNRNPLITSCSIDDTHGFSELSRLKTLELKDCLCAQHNNGIVAVDAFHAISTTRGLELSLSNNSIAVLDSKAFVEFSDLAFLDLSANRELSFTQVSALNLTNTNLRELHINAIRPPSAGVVDYALGSLFPTSLRTLHLRNAQIVNLEWQFTSLNLTEIDLSDNSIERFPQKLPPTLQTLVLTDNNIQGPPPDASLQDLGNLKTLKLHSNPIGKFGADFLWPVKDSLLYLDLSYCQLTDDLPTQFLSPLNKIEHLILDNNPVLGANIHASMWMTLGSLHSLRSFSMTSSKLRKFDLALRELHSIRHVDLGGNPLGSWVSSPEATMTFKSASLEELDLNNILDIGLHVDLASNIFQHLTGLKVIDLQGNNIDSLPVEALLPLNPTLRTLNLQSNPIRTLQPKAFFPQVGLSSPQLAIYLDSLNCSRCADVGPLKSFLLIEPERPDFSDVHCADSHYAGKSIMTLLDDPGFCTDYNDNTDYSPGSADKSSHGVTAWVVILCMFVVAALVVGGALLYRRYKLSRHGTTDLTTPYKRVQINMSNISLNV